jgi:hypothetical protein
MPPRASAALALALALALAACGKTSEPDAPPFTFEAVTGMSCADGSPTGIGISRGSSAVLLFLNGGGACWGAGACDASPGPFGAPDLALLQASLPGTILDRKLAGNPFAGFTMVFLPYCTGDVHAGSGIVQTYGPPVNQTWRHRGHPNIDAALAWIDANLPRPTRIVVTGSSAGGFGSLLAYDLVRTRWPSPAVTAALLDDSGPTFEPASVVTPGLSPALVGAWWDAWGLESTVAPVCSTCKGDLSSIWGVLSGRYQDDRFALLSSVDDPTIEGFFDLLPLDFGSALSTLSDRIDGLPNALTFRTPTRAHALLASPAYYRGGSMPLLAWLDPIAVGTGAFASAGP